jgi:hypothetical protein
MKMSRVVMAAVVLTLGSVKSGGGQPTDQTRLAYEIRGHDLVTRERAVLSSMQIVPSQVSRELRDALVAGLVEEATRHRNHSRRFVQARRRQDCLIPSSSSTSPRPSFGYAIRQRSMRSPESSTPVAVCPRRWQPLATSRAPRSSAWRRTPSRNGRRRWGAARPQVDAGAPAAIGGCECGSRSANPAGCAATAGLPSVHNNRMDGDRPGDRNEGPGASPAGAGAGGGQDGSCLLRWGRRRGASRANSEERGRPARGQASTAAAAGLTCIPPTSAAVSERAHRRKFRGRFPLRHQ